MLAEEALHEIEVIGIVNHRFHMVRPHEVYQFIFLYAVSVVAVSHYLSCADTTINVGLPEYRRVIHTAGCAYII